MPSTLRLHPLTDTALYPSAELLHNLSIFVWCQGIANMGTVDYTTEL